MIYERDYDAFRELMADVAAQYKTEPMGRAGFSSCSLRFPARRSRTLSRRAGAHQDIPVLPRAADILQQIEGTVEDRRETPF